MQSQKLKQTRSSRTVSSCSVSCRCCCASCEKNVWQRFNGSNRSEFVAAPVGRIILSSDALDGSQFLRARLYAKLDRKRLNSIEKFRCASSRFASLAAEGDILMGALHKKKHHIRCFYCSPLAQRDSWYSARSMRFSSVSVCVCVSGSG